MMIDDNDDDFDASINDDKNGDDDDDVCLKDSAFDNKNHYFIYVHTTLIFFLIDVRLNAIDKSYVIINYPC